MGQTNYSLGPNPGVPGKVWDLSALRTGDIVSFVAGILIPFGVMVELNSTGKLQPVQDINANWPPTGTVAGTSLAGVSVWDPEGVMQDFLGSAPTVPPTGGGSSTAGYPKGFRVPVLRRGRIWVQYDNTGTATRIGAVNVWHSSDGTHAQGVFTFAAPATTAGAEVSVAPVSFEFWNPENTTATIGSFTDAFGNVVGMAVVNVNLPSSGS
jgi:hypothetical protein